MGPSGPLVAAFERDTRIRVTYVNMNGDALLARIYAEGRHPGWDLAWFVGDAAAAELDRSGLLRSFPDAFAAGASAAAWTPAARAMLPADRAWLPTGLVIAGVFATLRNAPAPSPSWSALLSRSGAVGLVDPGTSGTAFPVLSGMMVAAGGAGPGHALLAGLRHRLEVTASNPSMLRALHAGKVSLAVLPSEAAFGAAARDPSLRVTVPEPAPVVPAVLAMSAGAGSAARERALRFARFVLDPHGQAMLRSQPAEGLEWPAASRTVPAPLPALEFLRWLHPDPGVWGEREGREIGWFHRLFTTG